MLSLYKPEPADLWFKQQMLSDEATMAYNRAWGGTLPFPEDRWAAWHSKWVGAPASERFYRYLADEAGHFVGETAYHYDAGRGIYLADVLVYAPCRGRGFGGQGLDLLCAAAKANGLTALYDDIAADNPSVALFLRHGFTEVSRSIEAVLVKKEL